MKHHIKPATFGSLKVGECFQTKCDKTMKLKGSTHYYLDSSGNTLGACMPDVGVTKFPYGLVFFKDSKGVLAHHAEIIISLANKENKQ